MSERITDFLRADHRALHVDLDLARAGVFDEAAFARFRLGLLRHIAIEEKILFPATRDALGDDARVLKVEHAAIAMLLVPTPDRALADELASVLAGHDAREERDGGVYPRCEALLDEPTSAALAVRARAFPAVRASRYLDRPGAPRTAAAALGKTARRGP